jgi:hypothetical protein
LEMDKEVKKEFNDENRTEFAVLLGKERRQK